MSFIGFASLLKPLVVGFRVSIRMLANSFGCARRAGPVRSGVFVGDVRLMEVRQMWRSAFSDCRTPFLAINLSL